MEKIKKIILLFIIFIIIIIISILILLQRNEGNANGLNNEEYLEEEELIPERDDKGYIDVVDANIFYSVVNSVNKYVYIMQYDINNESEVDDDIYIQYDIDREYLFDIKTEKQRLEAIYALLDEEYKDSNRINLDNIENFIYEIDDSIILVPIQMKAKYGTNINTFILKAYLNGNQLEERYFIVRTNNKNQTFSIEFISDNNSNIERIQFNENDNIIEKNNFNEFKIETIRTEKIAQNYLENYRDLSIQYPEIVYNNYLDKEYREKRFGSLENYKKYIEDNKEELEYVQIVQYLVEAKDNITKYVCLDQYENTYIFTQTAMMQYTVVLDTYTIESDKFRSTYDSSSEQNKVMMNVDKFIMMLNNRDYNAAYNLLDETFRNNTFNSEERFEEYIRNKYPLHYKVEYTSFEKRGSDIFIQNINLTDITEMDINIINFSIIMRLDEGTNFTMSFEI